VDVARLNDIVQNHLRLDLRRNRAVLDRFLHLIRRFCRGLADLAPASRALLVSTGPEAPSGEFGTTFALVVHLPTRNAPTPTRTITTKA
jgi:hypothetical protein